MPQKLTTTACFIQEESSGGDSSEESSGGDTTWRFLLDETGCSGKFLRHFYDYTFRSVYMSLSTLLYFANQNYLVYIYIYILQTDF